MVHKQKKKKHGINIQFTNDAVSKRVELIKLSLPLGSGGHKSEGELCEWPSPAAS